MAGKNEPKPKSGAPPGKDLGGRPPKDFDQHQFETMCKSLLNEKQICEVFRTTDKTLSNWCKRTYGKGFSDTYKMLSADGKASLLNILWKHAQRSPGAAIYMAKVFMGLREDAPDPEEKALKLRILRAQAAAAENGGSDPVAGRQVIIINDTRSSEDGGPGADPDKPADNT